MPRVFANNQREKAARLVGQIVAHKEQPASAAGPGGTDYRRSCARCG